MNKGKVITVAVMLTPAQLQYLDMLAAVEDLNRSQVVRKIIRDHQGSNKKVKG